MPDSGPRGASVNDDIEKELCSLIDEAMREVIALHGPGDPAGKFDIKSAYRLVLGAPMTRKSSK